MIENLQKMFNIRYAKQLADMNKNVYPAALGITEDGKEYFDTPIVNLGPGGGTLHQGNTKDVIELNPPAIVSLEFKKLKPETLIYVINIPRSEAEIAEKNSAYFNYLFDSLLSKALSNYKATIGSHEDMRFGSEYVRAEPFKEIGSEYVQFKLVGSFASTEEIK